MADKVFRSWAEDYAHNDREWRYDPDKVRRAMQIRRAARNQLHLQNHNGNAARAAIERAAEQERRRNDPLEQAKAWLGTHLRVPVYAASVAGGPEGKIVVGRTLHSPEEVIEMARAGAERLREKAARAPAVQATTPASAAPSPLVLIRPIAPPAATATPEPQAPNAEAPHPDITPPQCSAPAIPTERKEVPMVTYASGNKPITVPAPLDVYQHIAAIARAEDMALGQAALLLIRRAIDDGGESDAHTPTEDDRQSRLIADDAATPAPLPLESIALEALLAEIRRRVENAADDEALGEAIARAEAAEGKLAQLRAALA